jgi:CheY-like chemotaxis protein
MSSKRILVIDDDPDLLFLAAHGIKSSNLSYEVSTAPHAAAALAQVKAQPFDVIVTDYMMPDMTGLELIPLVRKIAPETTFVVMTAHHDTGGVRRVAMSMGVSGFVNKPFVLMELLDAIQQASAQPVAKVQPAVVEAKEFISQTVIDRLAECRRYANALSVILADGQGTPVHVSGHPKPERAARLTAFIAGSFAAVNEVAGLFDDHNPGFRSSYYEGDQYNIYAHEISNNFFLVVVFGTDIKPGGVWFYTKQTVKFLRKLLPDILHIAHDKARGNLARDFEQILGEATPDHDRGGTV